MKVTCVVQARMGSTRLPGKVLMDLGGSPLLGFMLDRLQRDPDVTVVVATSSEPGDDAVEECALASGAAVVRGSEADVLDRFRLVHERFPSAHLVRLTADCPLVDADLVRAAVAEHLRSGADYTSNTLVRTFPDGLDVEVLTGEALRQACAEATDPFEREHVTPFVYRHDSRFRLRALRTPERLGHLRWTVDTATDLDRLRAIVGDHPARRMLGWRVILGGLELRDRTPLMDGFEPAAPVDLPDGVATDPNDYCDPTRHLLVYRRDGRNAGWLAVRVTDGEATTRGRIDRSDLSHAQQHYDAFLATTPQITGGDVSLEGVHLNKGELVR